MKMVGFIDFKKKYSHQKIIDRISINAKSDEDLIKALDDLLGQGKVKGYYKTPDNAAD